MIELRFILLPIIVSLFWGISGIVNGWIGALLIIIGTPIIIILVGRWVTVKESRNEVKA